MLVAEDDGIRPRQPRQRMCRMFHQGPFVPLTEASMGEQDNDIRPLAPEVRNCLGCGGDRVAHSDPPADLGGLPDRGLGGAIPVTPIRK